MIKLHNKHFIVVTYKLQILYYNTQKYNCTIQSFVINNAANMAKTCSN